MREAVIVERQERAIRFEETWQPCRTVVVPKPDLQGNEWHSGLDKAPRPNERFPVPGNRTR